MMKVGKYQIYEFYNEKEDLCEKFFFPPNTTPSRFINKTNVLTDFKCRGFVVASIHYVDKETYLNAKLDDTVEDYLYNDQQEQHYRELYSKGEMSEEAFITTLECVQNYRWTILKKLSLRIRRLIREDFEIRNELAIQLYDLYLQASL